MGTSIRFTTVPVRGVNVHIAEKHAYQDPRKPKRKEQYKITILLDKETIGEAERTRIENFYEEARHALKIEYGLDYGGLCPFYDGDSMSPEGTPYPEYKKGNYCLQFYSDFQPKLFSPDGTELDPSEAYSGMNCQVAATFKTGVGQQGPFISRYVDGIKFTDYEGERITNDVSTRFE